MQPAGDDAREMDSLVQGLDGLGLQPTGVDAVEVAKLCYGVTTVDLEDVTMMDIDSTSIPCSSTPSVVASSPLKDRTNKSSAGSKSRSKKIPGAVKRTTSSAKENAPYPVSGRKSSFAHPRYGSCAPEARICSLLDAWYTLLHLNSENIEEVPGPDKSMAGMDVLAGSRIFCLIRDVAILPPAFFCAPPAGPPPPPRIFACFIILDPKILLDYVHTRFGPCSALLFSPVGPPPRRGYLLVAEPNAPPPSSPAISPPRLLLGCCFEHVSCL
ncbi:hypothetical protein B0H16DRAFT_1693293 [Mycena metata]|uniref:Uncharacterized protein n=1 Tax=Mycena metata TaxID=1033252 RepID=A0AAD7ILE1_9AGAR|nr:hypothetical protein B0H16DRAFT_1693293 [Mycena metata]